jgi:hypothetical protein
MTDLSRQVAEVMGWKESEHPQFCVSPNGEVQMYLPDYANDLNLAMEFAQTYKGKVEIHLYNDGEYQVIYYDITGPWYKVLWRSLFGKYEYEVLGKDTNLAAAICKAGLRALGKD